MKCPKCGSDHVRSYDNQSLYHPSKEQCIEEGYDQIGIDNIVFVHLTCDSCGNDWSTELDIVEQKPFINPKDIIDTINWKNTFNSDNFEGMWDGAMSGAFKMAKQCGYKYFTWNGRVHIIDGNNSEATEILAEDIDKNPQGVVLTKLKPIDWTTHDKGQGLRGQILNKIYELKDNFGFNKSSFRWKHKEINGVPYEDVKFEDLDNEQLAKAFETIVRQNSKQG